MKLNRTSATFAALALGSLALFGFGCNPFQKAQDKVSEKIGEKVAESVLGKATGGKVDLEKDGGQITFKDNKTGGTTSFGEDVKLPDDFPKVVPVYPGTKITGVTTSKEKGESAWIMMTTNDSVKKVVDWYAGQAKSANWTEKSNMTLNEMETRTYNKGEDETLSLSATADTEKGTTTIIVSWNKQEKPAATESEPETNE